MMGLAVNIIKRGGTRPTEKFMREKLHKSIAAACLSVHTPEAQAESIAVLVCDAMTLWLQNRPEVTSHDIRIAAAKYLKKFQPEAAYLYEQHRITI